MTNLITKILKYQKNPLSFVEDNLKVINAAHGEVPFMPNFMQKKLIEDMHELNEVSELDLHRQSGKTTAFCAFLSHYVTFNNNKTVAVFAYKKVAAMDIKNTFMRMYDTLPEEFKHYVIRESKTSVEFSNGMILRFDGMSFNLNDYRSSAISLAYCDEYDFCPHKTDFDIIVNHNKLNKTFKSIKLSSKK